MVGKPVWPCAVLLTLGVIALLAGGLALYARHAVLDTEAFAARATSTLQQDEVLDEIVARIADRTIAQAPELASRRPLLEDAVAEMVGSAAFVTEFHAGAWPLHHWLFDD